MTLSSLPNYGLQVRNLPTLHSLPSLFWLEFEWHALENCTTRIFKKHYIIMLSITGCDEKIKRGTVCEHRTLSLNCPLETVIEVSSANYGRLSKHICHSATSHRTTTCRASSSLNKVKASCNGKRSCKISASNRVFGDPCVGIFKYLEVNFICR